MKKPEQEHRVLYRAYRPHAFEEVRGQEHIVDTLTKAVKNGKVAHAYLFAGGRGTGKTTIARILAKALNTSDKDLYEMDAASNRGIDDIRMLREGVYAMPFESKYKFYIIDEAHMLTKEAWNALLKTLEEPPAHAIFVLATTEIEKVPDTIQSRCEVYTFKQPTREILAHMIGDVAQSEGYAIEKPAAELVALLAEGSFRDALSILQKVLAAAPGTKIESALVESVSGAPRGEMLRSLMRALADADAGAALAALSDAQKANLDARTFTRLLIERLRAVLLMRFAPDLAQEVAATLTEADAELIAEISKNPHITSETLRIVLEAYSTMAYAVVPFLPLELAIIDACKKNA